MGESTPLALPTGRRHIIERPRLTRLLDQTSARVIMLVAPAGYGKTTLAREWLANKNHAWYEANAAATDIAALALGIADATGHVVPGSGDRLREWLATSREPADEIEVLLPLLAEQLDRCPTDAWFAIDDYHFVASPPTEDLIARLFVEGGRRLLLTSRHRPSWSSARQLMYGSFFELGHSSLAMNADEAGDVLALSKADAATGLVALAHGWPAVIGLAALTPEAVFVDDELPQALYEYFAEELFSSLSDPARKLLPRLALLPIVTRENAFATMGAPSKDVVRESVNAGVLVARASDELELHPLLRAFLLRKLRELPTREMRSALEGAARSQIDDESWDGAFSIIRDFGQEDLLPLLISKALIPLLRDGRLVTLREWLEVGRIADVGSAWLDLADSELSFRQSHYRRAQALASAAARALPERDPLKSAAHYRAGQSSYLLDQADTALEHFRAAEKAASDPVDARNALWGQFIAAVELESSDAPQLLDQFTRTRPHDRDATVRAINGKLILAVRNGGIDDAIAMSRAIAELVSDASDPIIRSSFWHVYAGALMLSADYLGCLEGVDEALREIARFKVGFARPHALLNRAAANIGLRRFQEAANTLDEIERSAREPKDDYLLTNVKTLRCRLLLQENKIAQALAETSTPRSRQSSTSLQGEFLATRAIALVCAGEIRTACALLDRAESMSTQLEPRLLCLWARVMCSSALGQGNAEAEAHEAFAQTKVTGALDPFVFAYRVHPPLLQILAVETPVGDELTELLSRTNDSGLIRTEKLRSKAIVEHSAGILTAREREVYALLGKGKTNREIAAALVISEPTAKVHVRHVLQKLGVRSRTEAALQAARDSTDELEAKS